ncbi:MAG: alpha/beta hydrolase [Frankiales bacterium]|nr:alpha/beta hydrolase [Frankiales bacterium]
MPPISRRRALGLLGAVGAGIVGVGSAVRSFGSPAPRPKVAPGTERSVEAYGPLARQRGEWWVPPGAGTGPLPTVVLIHGGYWRDGFGPDLEDAVAADLAARGFLVWNVGYRPSSAPWPSTLADTALAFDHTSTGKYAARVDRDRLAVVGHSAGGHLALWLASRGRVPAGGPGAGPTLPPPTLAVGQAPVAGLAEGALLGLGGGAVQALLGGTPAQVPQRYAAADPMALLPSGVRSVLLHSEADQLVPISQSEGYAAGASSAGDDCRLVRVPGDHFAHLDPTSPAVAALREALGTLT